MTDHERSRLDDLRQRWRDLENRYLKERIKNDMPQEDREEMVRLSRQERDEERETIGPELYDWTVAMLFEEDPIRLAKMGVPKDEYELEARYLLRELHAKPVPHMNELHEMVWKLFSKMFGSAKGERESYRGIAEKLYFKFA